VSMLAVRLFVGSALTISFGLACRCYTFDSIAFNAAYFLTSLRFTFRVYV